MLKIAIIAGEPSGDILAARLIHALKEQSSQPIQLMGIGGEEMQKLGLNSSFNMSTLSVGGYGLDTIKVIPKILYIRHKIIQQIIEFAPHVFIGVDAPDFNFYVERKLKEHGIKTVHYISPTIWAWRSKRVFKIKYSTDLMLCAFPMEVPLYTIHNIKAVFVGHHLADEIDFEVDTEYSRYQLRLEDSNKYSKIFTILVGSRLSEIKKHTAIFIEACNKIAKIIPNALFLFPFVNQITITLFIDLIKSIQIDFAYKILLNQTREAIKSSDMAIVKSGTVTLEVALCKKPFIIVYKISKITEYFLRHLLKIKLVGLPNILLNEEVVHELLQDEANSDNLTQSFVNLYDNPILQANMINKFYKLHRLLKLDASRVASLAILKLVGESRLT